MCKCTWTKAVLNANGGHTNCYHILIWFSQKKLCMKLFLKASSLYSILTQVPQTLHSELCSFLQASWRCCHSSSRLRLFFHIIPDAFDDGQIRSLCGAYWLLSDPLSIQISHLIIIINLPVITHINNTWTSTWRWTSSNSSDLNSWGWGGWRRCISQGY